MTDPNLTEQMRVFVRGDSPESAVWGWIEGWSGYRPTDEELVVVPIKRDGELMRIAEPDADKVYVLVSLADSPNLRIAGWLFGEDVRLEWKNPRNKRNWPFYEIFQKDLRHPKSLLDYFSARS